MAEAENRPLLGGDDTAPEPSIRQKIDRTRQLARRWFESAWNHFIVLILTTIDVSCIFANFILSLYLCEHECGRDVGHFHYHNLASLLYLRIQFLVSTSCLWSQRLTASFAGRDRYKAQHIIQSVLELVSLVIACLFMTELIVTLWAFGLRYLKSWFHCLDAAVISASFILETCLRDLFEGEVGETIVVLRLWKVFQIVEEFGASANEHMEGLNERISDLTAENRVLRDQVAILRSEAGQ